VSLSPLLIGDWIAHEIYGIHLGGLLYVSSELSINPLRECRTKRFQWIDITSAFKQVFCESNRMQPK
jgi:hypothetical protein